MARRSESTCRGMAVRWRMSSKRRTPLNTSRRTTNDHLSPKTCRARCTVQLSTDQSSASGRFMERTLSLLDRLSKVDEAASMTQTQQLDDVERQRLFTWDDPTPTVAALGRRS